MLGLKRKLLSYIVKKYVYGILFYFIKSICEFTYFWKTNGRNRLQIYKFCVQQHKNIVILLIFSAGILPFFTGFFLQCMYQHIIYEKIVKVTSNLHHSVPCSWTFLKPVWRSMTQSQRHGGLIPDTLIIGNQWRPLRPFDHITSVQNQAL